jgi:hypothetical protein
MHAGGDYGRLKCWTDKSDLGPARSSPGPSALEGIQTIQSPSVELAPSLVNVSHRYSSRERMIDLGSRPNMARKMATRRVPALNFLPVLLSLISLVLIILTLAAGTRPGVLDDLYFLKVGRLPQSLQRRMSILTPSLRSTYPSSKSRPSSRVQRFWRTSQSSQAPIWSAKK